MPELVARWADVAWPSAAERSHVLTGLNPAPRPFSPYPGVDLADVYRFLELQPSSVRTAPPRANVAPPRTNAARTNAARTNVASARPTPR